MLEGKKILLGITGSIAAYKSALLTRLLIKEGAEVKVVMTPSARDFITPLTLSTLSKNPVAWDVSDGEGWNNHVELGLWADALVIAPATANSLAKMANGLCDNLLLATYLSARCPVFFAPAMDLDMWLHPATRKNMDSLKAYGQHLIPVGDGELASGLVGKGRMAEPEDIVALLNDFFAAKVEKDLAGMTVMLTSGPTHEAIDPVRFIGNRSSGKMGTALAYELAARGAKVIFITGPASVIAKGKNIQTIEVTSATEMYDACIANFDHVDAAIMAAAVADYTPRDYSDIKVKKSDNNLILELKRTKDIAKELGERKQNQLTVGFALETNDELANAQKKLTKKNFDFIVLNSLKDSGAGFRHDTNKITIVDKHNKRQKFELKTKTEVAKDIVDYLVQIKA